MAINRDRQAKNDMQDAQLNFTRELGFVMVQLKTALFMVGSYFEAQAKEVSIAAQENIDSDELKKDREATVHKKLEAERAEYEARIAKAQAEKSRFNAEHRRNTSQGQGQGNHGQRPHSSRPQQSPQTPRPTSAVAQRIEERRTTLKGPIKGLDEVDRSSLPPGPEQAQPEQKSA